MSASTKLADKSPAVDTLNPREQLARLRAMREVQRLIRQIDRLRADYGALRANGTVPRIEFMEADHE